MSTVKATNIQHLNSTTPNIVLSSDNSVSVGTTIYVPSINDGPISGSRNRIINGDMRIDQRYAGASVVVSAGASFFTLDRWSSGELTDGAVTIQRSGNAPVGFTSSYLLTITTADTSLSAGQYLVGCGQFIEGYNISDLNFGTANAKPFTVSFWVNCSSTGTFNIIAQNGPQNRTYVTTYAINSANTWEYKTVTIPGDTTGTWYTDHRGGLSFGFTHGMGSNFQSTADTWQTGNFGTTTGTVSLIGIQGATWYVTGVQLEAGTVATPFERRSYGQELALCQRYYEKSYNIDVAPGTNTQAGMLIYNGSVDGVGNPYHAIPFKVTKRTTPTLTYYSSSGSNGSWTFVSSTVAATSKPISDGTIGTNYSYFYVAGGISAWSTCQIYGHYTASAELP